MDKTHERMIILKMIEEDTLNVDEGAKLLASVDRSADSSKGRVILRSKDNSKWFRIRVTDTYTGKNTASVSLPMALMEWGLRVGAQFAPEVGNVDLGELSDILNQGLEGKIIDVLDEEDGEHVEIFID